MIHLMSLVLRKRNGRPVGRVCRKDADFGSMFAVWAEEDSERQRPKERLCSRRCGSCHRAGIAQHPTLPVPSQTSATVMQAQVNFAILKLAQSCR